MKDKALYALLAILLVTIACKQENSTSAMNSVTNQPVQVVENTSTAQVTFIEIGSVNCIPCRMMQPVMEKIAQKYGSKVSIVFYDVWTKEGAPYATTYGIRVIPTQVFLDSTGKEFFRHEGYFPFEAIDELLQKHGVKP
ncbi:MAG: thioredoxin family protein [Spirochaetota bacterium]